jgi:threonine/homoserine/homoserine lactone efflux protein
MLGQMAELGAFLGISALVICTPGQDTALTIRNTLLGGRRGGVFTAVGVSVGQSVWALATSVGIAALIVASEPVFLAIRLVGAAYLVYLGAQALRRSLLGPVAGEAVSRSGDGRLTSARAFRQGVLSNLGNPKMAVFFTSLLPQFAPAGGGTFAVLLALGLAFCLLTLAWLSAYAVVVAQVGDILRRPLLRRLVDGLTGAALLAFGVRLAVEDRR